ncbi:MAG: hypothetical protein HZA61_01680 [Candidatus Eisenbacteria bacterium]|uniref:Uncharacterized protein n=1 Tax=Eiseniibacteriota bacterium TaxID=2212470 RepID=A0A933W7Q8_UNCEI|nr:hypothetical protein [Candidatus Eisenbacteria bacterium]
MIPISGSNPDSQFRCVLNLGGGSVLGHYYGLMISSRLKYGTRKLVAERKRSEHARATRVRSFREAHRYRDPAAVSVLLLASRVLSAATSDVRAMLASESRQRIQADSLETHERQLTDRRLDRLTAITELVVLAVAEQTDVVERREALAQLRRMRRVAP